MNNFRKDQELTERHNLRKCSMNRCCNAELVDKLVKALEFYGYPSQLDGDRAYIYGFEARKALEEFKNE